METPIYLTIAEILEIHRQLIEAFGGIHGVRDRGLLESAVFRPQSGYYEKLLEQAAALMESLANNHAFLDGNKRVAFASADVFLRLNGFYLDVDSMVASNFITDKIAARQFRVPIILKWFQEIVKKRHSSE